MEVTALRYSLDWAKVVLGCYLAKHTRAAETVNEYCALDTDFLAFLIASGAAGWRRYKALVRTCERAGRLSLANPQKVFRGTPWEVRNRWGIVPPDYYTDV